MFAYEPYGRTISESPWLWIEKRAVKICFVEVYFAIFLLRNFDTQVQVNNFYNSSGDVALYHCIAVMV